MNKIQIGLMSLLLAAAGCAQQAEMPIKTLESSEARAAIDAVYSGFAEGDIAMAVSTMSPDIEWREAQGNPYADKNPYIGPDAVVSGLFARLGGEWDGFSATPEEFVSEGGRVVVFGRYNGVYKATGKSLDAPFVHSWTVEDGKITQFQQYTDTAGQVAAMSIDSE